MISIQLIDLAHLSEVGRIDKQAPCLYVDGRSVVFLTYLYPEKDLRRAEIGAAYVD